MGSHDIDVCRWALPDGAVPKSVVSLGGRFGYKDQGQTPNTQLTMFDFGEVKLLHEVRGLVEDRPMEDHQRVLHGRRRGPGRQVLCQRQ